MSNKPCKPGCICRKHRAFKINVDAGYSSRHAYVHRLRGKAADQICVDCGNQAREWSQVHGTDGTDPHEHYQARCALCHRIYDLGDRVTPEETREKIRQALVGRTIPEDVRLKMSASQRRRIAERGASMQGKTHSLETRRKMSESQTGKIRSLEARQRMSDAAKARWARQRNEA